MNRFSGVKLRTHREQRGLSREQLSIKSRVAASSISVYEGGHAKPGPDATARLATALRVRVKDLLEEPAEVAR